VVPEAGHSLGCGAHVKGSLALQDDRILVIGPHIGDLDGAGNRQRYRQQKRSLPTFFQVKGSVEVTDLRPDYDSTLEADYRAPSVPHHIAHAMATWLEHQPEPPFQVLTWDGVGLGPDGSIWGGECLQFDAGFRWRRRASLYRFHLAPGAAVARYPGRVARALAGERPVGNSAVCSSMGRLIEGMAALAGLREENLYEAQIAMEWEALGHAADEGASMEFAMAGPDLDWRPLLPVITDQRISIAARSLGFHRALARAAVRQCMQGRGRQILLSGGVFQNRLLVELLLAEAHASGLQILLPERLPPNDGGIAAGQCVALAMAVRQQGAAQPRA
jgi:hydrogenase maturation protein HypF